MYGIPAPGGGYEVERKFLVHEPEDNVGVAVKDIAGGENVEGIIMRGRDLITITAIEPVPFGHKIALEDMATGTEVKRYGANMGVTTQPIPKGAHVHVHNVRSTRC